MLTWALSIQLLAHSHDQGGVGATRIRANDFTSEAESVILQKI